MRTKVSYGDSKTGDDWLAYEQFLTDLIDQHGSKSVCDIGGGANPLLENDYVQKSGIRYTILDISETELDKAPTAYNKIVADIASSEFKTEEKFDLIFSKMLAEHIEDPLQFHANVMKLLSDDGIAVHLFPTFYAMPFLVNRIVPESLSTRLLDIIAPRDRYQKDKFSAYYRWCRGPTRRQIQRFRDMGYQVLEYRGYFGHSGYYDRIKPLKRLHQLKTAYLLKHPNAHLTSFAVVMLMKA